MMPPDPHAHVLDLFDPLSREIDLDPGARLLTSFAAAADRALLAALAAVVQSAPFRRMVTPGGWPMSVAMTNCGSVGWVTDQTGYRYDRIDPQTGHPWPPIPAIFADLAIKAADTAGLPGFSPDACLINRYEAEAKMSLHQDRNERDFCQPIVSVSLGLPAVFLWGGSRRTDRPRRIALEHGDVVVWGGPARKTYHGVHRLSAGQHPLTRAIAFGLN